jgi:hypothetical protein
MFSFLRSVRIRSLRAREHVRAARRRRAWRGEPLEERRLLAQLAFFANGAFVDTTAGTGEAVQLDRELQSLGHVVVPFGGISQLDIRAALLVNQALVIPELEQGNLFAQLGAGARDELRNYVSGGGSIILMGSPNNSNETDLLNGLFGFGVSAGANASSGTSTRSAAADATLFVNGPSDITNQNATAQLAMSSLPFGAKSIYGSGSNTAVATFRYGSGQVIYVGYDWFDGETVPGSANGGWRSVLNVAVSQSTTFTYESTSSQSLLLRREGAGFRIRDANTLTVLAEKRDIETNQILITGAASLNTSLTVDRGFDGDVNRTVFYNAGQAGGVDTLTIRGGNYANIVHGLSTAFDGSTNHGGQLIQFTGVETVNDVSAAQSYSLTTTNNNDIVEVIDGPSVNGVSTTRYRSTNGSFGEFNIGNKSNVTFNTAGGVDQITLDNPAASSGLHDLRIDSGVGEDTVNVFATSDDVRTTVTSSGDRDQVNVGEAGRVNAILGLLTVTNPSSFTALRIDDSAETAARNVVVREDTVRELAPANIDYVEADISSLTVLTGAGADVINVQSTAQSRPTTINTGAGADLFDVAASGLGASSTNTFQGGDAADTLTIRSGTFASATLNLTDAGAGNLNYDGRAVNYTSFETMNELTAVTTLEVTATADADAVEIVNGPTLFGLATTQVRSTNGTVGVTNLSNKSSLSFDSAAGADSITLNNPGGATGLTAIKINTGDTDGDAVTVLASRAGVATTITNTGGSDSVTIGNAGLLSGILGAITVNGVANLTALRIDDSASPAARNVTLTASSVTGLAPATISYAGNDISALTLLSGLAADLFAISSTAANRTTSVFSGDGADIFTINGVALGASSTNNFAGEGGDDVFTSSFSVTATINVDGGPHAVGDRMRYDFGGLGVVLMANSVGAAGRLPINATNVEFQDLIGLNGNIPSVEVRHSGLGGVSKITTTADPNDCVIQVQGGATYSLFNLAPNVPIAVNGSFLDDRLEIINTGSALLNAEISFEGALNSSVGDSLAFSGGGNLVVNEVHNATGAKSGEYNLDGVLRLKYVNLEALTDSMLAYYLTFNTPADAADQVAYGDGSVIPESHRIASGNNGFLTHEIASKVEVAIATGTGGVDLADTVNVATTIDMPLMLGFQVSTGAGADTLTINGTSPLPVVNVDMGTGSVDKLVVLAGDTPNELTITPSAVSGAIAPINYNASVETLEVFGQLGDDTFNVTASTSTRYVLHGDAQDVADTLRVDAQGQSVNAGKDSITVAGRQPIVYDGMEAGELISTGGAIPSLILTHDAAGGTSVLHTGDTAHAGSFQVQGGLAFTFENLAVGSIVQLQGSTGDDRLDFIHDGDVLLDVFLDFFGGAGGTDTLAFSGNQLPLADETHLPSGPNAGFIDFTGPFSARYADLDQLEDALPVTKLTWQSPANAADNVFYENGTFNPAAHQLRSGNSAFVTHQFTSKADVVVRLDAGAADVSDTLDVEVSNANTGLASLEFFAGAGDDIAAITVSAALPPTVYHAGAGSADALTVRGTLGDDALTVDATSVSGAGTSVTFDNEVESLRVDGRDGNDTIDVQEISAAIATVIAGGAGNDTATVQAPLPAVLTFEDGDGVDRLILVGTDAEETFNLGGTTLTGAGATINYTATLEHAETRGRGGLDEFFVAPNEVTEFFIDGGAPSRVIPGDRLEVDFAGTTGRRLSFTGPGEGAWTFTNRKRVGFTDVEEFNYFDLLAAGADAGATSAPQVVLLDSLSLEETIRLMAYEANYQEGVRVALGDLNGDGVPELVTAPGRNRGAEIRVFDVTSGAELPQYRFTAFDPGFIGGVYVAVGDVDGDGRNDIIASAGRGPSDVRVYRNKVETLPTSPFAGPAFRQFSPFGAEFIGGATVAAADMTGDGKVELIIGSSTGMRATVRVYNVSADATSYSPLRQYLPFDAEFRGGVFVSAGRINGDGVPDIIATQGPSGDARVELFDGLSGASFANFDGYTDASTTAPIRGAGADLDGDGMIERIVTSQGPDGRTNLVRGFTTTGGLVDQKTYTESQFLNGFHLASFFANKDVLASTVQSQPTAEDIVTKLYQQVLGRAPESAGLDYWVDRINAGSTYGTVASGIFESAERLDPIIKQMYRDYLLREAEPAGVTFYRDLWRADGGPDNVVANIISSAEFYASAGGTNSLWVTELYRRLLGREPDAAGLDYWTTRLDSGQLSRKQVVFGFTRSNENFTNLVTGWYQQYLGRTPSNDELTTRVNRMRNGATQREIQIELIDTPEYANTP